MQKLLSNKENNLPADSNRLPSPELGNLLKSLANDFINIHDKWASIKVQGEKEGFNEGQLADMVRSYLKEHGLSKDKIYYILHRTQNKEKTRNRKFPTIEANKDLQNTPVPEHLSTKGTITFDDIKPYSHTKSHLFQFDLNQASELKHLIEKAEKTNSRLFVVRIYAEEGIVKEIESLTIV